MHASLLLRKIELTLPRNHFTMAPSDTEWTENPQLDINFLGWLLSKTKMKDVESFKSYINFIRFPLLIPFHYSSKPPTKSRWALKAPTNPNSCLKWPFSQIVNHSLVWQSVRPSATPPNASQPPLILKTYRLSDYILYKLSVTLILPMRGYRKLAS